MRFRIFLALLAVCFLGMSKKTQVSIRFHTETNKQDSETFAMPVQLKNIRRATHLNRIPEFSERQIKSIFPFQAKDGTWGCVFQLDAMGRMRLETLSNEHRGEALVVFVATQKGLHQVTDLLIDRPVTDGVITVPSGLSELEVAYIRAQFPTPGQKPVKVGKPAKIDVNDWSVNPDPNPTPSEDANQPKALPRVAD